MTIDPDLKRAQSSCRNDGAYMPPEDWTDGYLRGHALIQIATAMQVALMSPREAFALLGWNRVERLP